MELKKFIEEFKKIPSKNVISDTFTNKKDSCCVIGHYIRLNSSNPKNYAYENCNDFSIDSEIRILGEDHNISLATINNGWDDRYRQKTAKKRSLAALNALLKLVES